MFSLVSNEKSAEVPVPLDAWQAPEKVSLLCCPEGVQLNLLPSAKLRSKNDGPVSDTTLGFVGEDPGSISIFRSQFSSFHD
jgi:hypothetical protein